MVEKLTKDDFDCGLIKSKTYNEPFLSTEIETIQLPNPFLGMTIKSPKFSIITESTKKSQIDLDQSIGFSAKNVLYENVQFDFSEIERLVKEENLSDYKTNKEFLEHFSETEKIIIMKIYFFILPINLKILIFIPLSNYHINYFIHYIYLIFRYI